MGLASSMPAQLTRVANTTLTFPAALPVFGFTTERALNNLSFDQPIAVVSAPGETHRLFVVEKSGRIIVVHNPGSANPTTSVFLDISESVFAFGEGGLLALAFHPQFATNGRFYVWYTLTTTTAAGEGLHDRLAQFRVSAANPDIADASSEVPMISQFDEADNHNGGEIKFGPDGYLYLSTGDEGGGADYFQNGQRIDKDFFSSVFRIDVDQRTGSLAPNIHASVHLGTYRVPPDNPFVGATSFNGLAVNPAQVRTEIWATGLRNPFRMSFDSATGRLWLGDVGQNMREEINLITRGANYGWSFREGSIAHAGTPPAEAVLTEPIYDYPHADGYSVIGGLVYRGEALSQLIGSYLFADYESGTIWSLRYDGTAPAEVQQLTSNVGVVSFGLNPANGDILLANISEGSIRRLVYNSAVSGASLPATLTATGAFTSLTTLAPAPGIVAYEPNVSFWSDHANKRRWFGVPALADKITFAAEGNWTFPAGTVWVKHFDLELTRGVPSTARRLETRFLVKTTDGIYGVTYKWNNAQTEAMLVPEEGENESIPVIEDGVPRTQIWRYPSRSECMQCHAAVGGHALSFNTAQLNRSVAYGSGPANQLAALAAAGYFAVSSVPNPATLRALAPADDSSATLEYRVRSYLASNCGQCHQPGGTALGQWDARIQTPTANAGLLDGALVNNGGDSANRVIASGDVAHSMMLTRISTRGAGQMPPLGSTEVDTANVALLTAWINGMSAVTFTTQPLSQTVTRGTSVTFTALAVGTSSPTYQWKKGGVNIGGATSSTYKITSTTANDAGMYTVVATSGNNSVTSNVATLTVNKAAAVVTLGGLNATYTGSPRAASAVTTPVSLRVNFSYDGSATAPTNAGTYAVIGTINDPDYQGSASGTLVIAKASATVVLGNLSATYDGASHAATATTAPSSLAVGFTYNGLATVPTNAGTYAVVATINNPNYAGSASGLLVIGKATAIVTWATPSPITYGTALSGSQLNASANVAGSFIYNPPAGTVLNPGTQTLNVSFTPADLVNRTGTSAQQFLLVNVAPAAPSFTTHPASQSVPVGTRVTLSAAASGVAAPTYQWRKGGVAINGATNSSYAIASVALSDAGNYTVVATNAVGSATSNVAVLTVLIAVPSNAVISFTVE